MLKYASYRYLHVRYKFGTVGACDYWVAVLAHYIGRGKTHSWVSMSRGQVPERVLARSHLASSDIGSMVAFGGYGAMKRFEPEYPEYKFDVAHHHDIPSPPIMDKNTIQSPLRDLSPTRTA